MFCKQCGQKLSEESVFCNKCGTKVECCEDIKEERETEEVVDVENVQVYERVEEINDTDKTLDNETAQDLTFIEKLQKFIKDNKGVSIGVIVGVLLILFLIIFALAGGSEPSGDGYSDSGYVDNTPDPTVDIQWISDRRVQYNKEDEQYVVFFGLQDANHNYVSASGTVKIRISDESGNELYNNEIAFTKNDFTEWTNQSWDSARYMCGIYIKRSDVKGGASTGGVLSLAVECEDGTSFDADNLTIYDLPSKKVSIKMPSTPAKIYNYNYKGSVETIISVEKITYETESSYDGTARLIMKFNVKLIANYTDTSGHTSKIGYKLKNSDGVIVKSGHFYVSPMEVGEIALEEETIYDLDPNDSYVLTFENTK